MISFRVNVNSASEDACQQSKEGWEYGLYVQRFDASAVVRVLSTSGSASCETHHTSRQTDTRN